MLAQTLELFGKGIKKKTVWVFILPVFSEMFVIFIKLFEEKGNKVMEKGNKNNQRG